MRVWAFPSARDLKPVRYYLASRFNPRSQVAGCGAAPDLCLFGLSPNRRGGVAVTPSADPGRNLRIKEFFDVV
jgi:hypothetical protein